MATPDHKNPDHFILQTISGQKLIWIAGFRGKRLWVISAMNMKSCYGYRLLSREFKLDDLKMLAECVHAAKLTFEEQS